MPESYWVLLLISLLLIALVFSKVKASLLFFSVAALLFLAGLLPEKDFLGSFSNSGLVTLMMVLISTIAIEKTWLIRKISIFISRGGSQQIMPRLGLSTLIASAFLNNTAVVAGLTAAIKKNQEIPARKVLIPLSFLSILGGVCTLIGTSTNLILNSFLIDAGLKPLAFFDFLPIGVLAALSGYVVIHLGSRWLEGSATTRQELNNSDYFVDARVLPESRLCGKTVLENGLRTLESLFLAEIVRGNTLIAPVSPTTEILEGDVLIFTGDVNNISQIREFHGLQIESDRSGHIPQNFTEVIVLPYSDLLGRSIKEIGFRARFDAAVVAIRRRGVKLSGKIGQQELQSGDNLILATGKDFFKHTQKDDFVQLNDIKIQDSMADWKQFGAISSFVLAIFVSAVGFLDFFTALFINLLFLVTFKILRIEDIRNHFPAEIWLVIGSALCITKSMEFTGLANSIGMLLGPLLNSGGSTTALIVFYFAALLLTQLVTNNAAAAMLAPIAIAFCTATAIPITPVFLALAYGASACFIFPYGYQTNLIVMAAGNYSQRDFFRLGVPLTLVYSIVCLMGLTFMF
jgi:di/tricarboxylate transporter